MKRQIQKYTRLYDSQIAKETPNREARIIRICTFLPDAIVTDAKVALTSF